MLLQKKVLPRDMRKKHLPHVKDASSPSGGRWFVRWFMQKNVLPREPTEEPSRAIIKTN